MLLFIIQTHTLDPFKDPFAEPSYSVGGNVNWCNHYGEQYSQCGVSFKN